MKSLHFLLLSLCLLFSCSQPAPSAEEAAAAPEPTGTDIEARLQADVSSAQAALLSATSALEAARGTLATAQSGGDEGAISAAEDAVEGAERTVSSAERGVSDAQRAFERGLSSERSDMARLLSCDRLKLTTNRRDVTARNSRDARDACAALRDNGSATVVWEFQIDRYEVPVALTFSLGRDAQFVPIASQALSVFDIH